MSHTPFGYRIKNGKVEIDIEAAEKIRALFRSYLSGDSLSTAATKAGIKAYHASIGRILQNPRYLGDEYYPAIIDTDTFKATETERIRRAEKLGRIFEPKEAKDVVFPTVFRMGEVKEEYDDPFRQAEYIYSLIELEENENGSQ